MDWKATNGIIQLSKFALSHVPVVLQQFRDEMRVKILVRFTIHQPLQQRKPWREVTNF